ncbi:hypothetical protein YYE_04899 [Plasmodium vinckei vinckei]|uniref:Uncharacterized protein n=1 Tax=Plasmodium vinckei vinckei TaxID=54757 RepID=A0A081I9N0_PLAVN|nr:hypothetical protein YYE_04899 [Plasmodium vinckei vinckei]
MDIEITIILIPVMPHLVFGSIRHIDGASFTLTFATVITFSFFVFEGLLPELVNVSCPNGGVCDAIFPSLICESRDFGSDGDGGRDCSEGGDFSCD